MKKFITTFLLISFLYLNGCATLFSGSSEDISLESDPPKAKVLLNGSTMGKTPLTLKLKKGNSYIIEFMKEGYENKTLSMSYSLGAGWLILDILSGLIGIIVDASTGNWNEFDFTHYKAVMDEKEK
ncbi:MAG: PEGA domain-containing protein [Ignavibacteria bacterium]|nr:PEGA domain-containing protein [Ignavibacteria bacterium]